MHRQGRRAFSHLGVVDLQHPDCEIFEPGGFSSVEQPAPFAGIAGCASTPSGTGICPCRASGFVPGQSSIRDPIYGRRLQAGPAVI